MLSSSFRNNGAALVEAAGGDKAGAEVEVEMEVEVRGQDADPTTSIVAITKETVELDGDGGDSDNGGGNGGDGGGGVAHMDRKQVALSAKEVREYGFLKDKLNTPFVPSSAALRRVLVLELRHFNCPLAAS